MIIVFVYVPEYSGRQAVLLAPPPGNDSVNASISNLRTGMSLWEWLYQGTFSLIRKPGVQAMNSNNNARLKLVGAGFLLIGAAIIFQMIRVQNSPQAKDLIAYLEKTYNQEVRVIKPERGNIYDRWGNLLAGNTEVYEVGIAPPQVTNSDTVAQDLSSILGLDYTTIKTIARSYVEEGNEKYMVVADFVPPTKFSSWKRSWRNTKKRPPNREKVSAHRSAGYTGFRISSAAILKTTLDRTFWVLSIITTGLTATASSV